ncbi:MAG: hypothetical protein ACK5X3_08295, partial [Pseudomonadota bacterium]
MAGSPPRKTASTPRRRPAEGSPRAIFAALLKWHIDAGTRPAGKNGVGSLNIDSFARDVGVSKRMMEYYRDGRRLPRDLAKFLEVLFADDPRHATARATLRGAFDAARGIAAPAGAVALSNIPIRIPTHVMGREEPLALIHAALCRYAGRVASTALHGRRGVGKTVLAAAYA